jgi:hypothetical protein
MQIFALILGIFLIATILLDAFETIVLPRTVRRAVRLTTGYFWLMSIAYTRLGGMRKCPRRQTILNGFAPMMLIGLIGLWALSMIVGFALILYGAGQPLVTSQSMGGFEEVLYFSGVTFFTLGFGDVIPSSGVGRLLSVCEAGVGFGFLALIIAYIPVIYSAFSRREIQMLLLDSKAGSEPTATELLRRHGAAKAMPALTEMLKDWERFSAELLEAYLSYPVLAYYRSQHDDQSWLRSLTAIMDVCALIEAGFEGEPEWECALCFQAQATFAMARHVVVDLAYILNALPQMPAGDRLTPDGFRAICEVLKSSGLSLNQTEKSQASIRETRALYEPFVNGLGNELIMDLPNWFTEEHIKDNWETTAWDGAKHF